MNPLDWMMRHKVKAAVGSFALGFILGLSSCTVLKLDRSVSAAEGNAATLFLSGPDQEPLKGRVYVEIRDGALPTQTITMHVPQVACKRDNCIAWQVIRNDGSFGLAGSIARGETTQSLSVAQISGIEEPVHHPIDGEYQVLIRVYYLGPDGQERQSTMRGFIRIVVTTAEYQPMGCGDPNVAWELRLNKQGSCKAQYSTALRAARCGKCSINGVRT